MQLATSILKSTPQVRCRCLACRCLQEMPFEEVQRCWQAYTQGNYLEARPAAYE